MKSLPKVKSNLITMMNKFFDFYKAEFLVSISAQYEAFQYCNDNPIIDRNDANTRDKISLSRLSKTV